MAEIKHEIKINSSPDKIYKAISTIEGLKAWHSALVSGDASKNGTITFTGAEKPTFNWKVEESIPDKTIVWTCTVGPGDAPGTQAIFKISNADSGRSLVELRHTEWPGEHGNFTKCNTLWGVLLHHLKQYVETGKTEPAFKG